jgi:anti-sigma factor RsiW
VQAKREQPTKECKELQQFLHVFVDGEFDQGDEREVSLHLSQCPSCLGEVARIETLKQRTKTALPQHKASATLHNKINETFSKAPKIEAVPSRLSWWLAPLAASFFGIGVFASSYSADPVNQQEVIADSIKRHERELPIEIPGPNTAQVSLWFEGKVAFPVRVPRFPEGTHLLGGRLSAVNEEMAAHLTYEKGGRKITVLIFDPTQGNLNKNIKNISPNRVIIKNRDVYLSRTKGYQVAVFEDKGVGYTITADLDEDDLTEIVASGLNF